MYMFSFSFLIIDLNSIAYNNNINLCTCNVQYGPLYFMQNWWGNFNTKGGPLCQMAYTIVPTPRDVKWLTDVLIKAQIKNMAFFSSQLNISTGAISGNNMSFVVHLTFHICSFGCIWNDNKFTIKGVYTLAILCYSN